MTSNRAQARESIAAVWHQRRQHREGPDGAIARGGATRQTITTTTVEQHAPITNETLSEKPSSPSNSVLQGLPSLCALIQKAWDQTGLVVKQRLRLPGKPARSPTNNNSSSSGKQVFPSILPIIQAHVLAEQVDYLHEDEAVVQDALLSVFPADYNFDKAIRRMTQKRSRAFWLIDLAHPIRRLVQWQKQYPAQVRFLYRLSANADAILLRVLERLERTGIVVQSNWDLSATQGRSTAEQQFLYDDTTSCNRTDGYLRRAVLGQQISVLTVDGPAEVDRIVNAVQRLATRRRVEPPSVDFLLRLPGDTTAWGDLTMRTWERIQAVGAQLAGISVDLSEQREQRESALETLLTARLQTLSNLRVDITGLDWENSQWWWQRLPRIPNVREITVDATEPLIGSAGALCTRIIGCKIMPDQRRHYYIDDGCYGSLYQTRDAPPLPLGRTTQEEQPTPLEKDDTETPLYTSTVWGPTCDGLDRVCPNVKLPALWRDDWLVFPNISGTSGQGLGTAFNGFSPPDTVYVILGYFK